MMYEDESNAMYKKKLLNTVIFGVVAELIYVSYDVLRFNYK